MAGSDHGRALMAALLAGMERHLPGLRPLPRHLVRYLIGDRLADDLGVPPDRAFHAKLALLRLLPGLPGLPGGPLASLSQHAASLVGRPLLDAIVAVKLGGDPATLEMPQWSGGAGDGGRSRR